MRLRMTMLSQGTLPYFSWHAIHTRTRALERRPCRMHSSQLRRACNAHKLTRLRAATLSHRLSPKLGAPIYYWSMQRVP